MKPITNRLASIAGPLLFPLGYLLRKGKKKNIALLLVIAVVLTSCFQHYFRTNTQENVDAAAVQKLLAADKYFIVHFGNTVKKLLNVSVTAEKLEADIDALSPEHAKYLDPNTEQTNRVKFKDKINTLAEVHLYTTQVYNVAQTHISILLSSLNRMDIYTFDAKATTSNHVLSIVGMVAGVFAVVGIIVLISCNCPQVFVNNNGQYEFVSGVYSGAIYSSLERTDYLPLPSSAVSGNTFQLKIANVKNEEQFINREQLIQVSHPEGSAILIDRHGTVFSYDKPMAPVSAIINGQTDIKKQLASTDNDSYLFDGEKGEKGFSNVVLTFDKPFGTKKAKLVVHGGNSVWSGYIYHSFNDLFGSGYDKWKEAKDRSDPKEMEQWQTNQELPLMVYIEKNGRWELADYFAHTGNTASRDLIMELDVSKIQAEQVKIKLETVYQFWDLDFAGIDFSDNQSTISNLVNASSVIKSDGSEQKEALNQCDKQYCHLGTDENIVLQYPVTPALNGNVTSYFLVSS
jgi:hypothetical protein